jgi:hypothetical protein
LVMGPPLYPQSVSDYLPPEPDQYAPFFPVSALVYELKFSQIGR